ncbi:hypothetical protein EMEDMD4_590013 [Sinorhizobium medicae]|uniref:Uncharacterized protein n=1 Tax=Sinorhizobium medicae TaxID=110321 RepID=A0A508X642_9HYPH|nr:hypothetical protein EMEDMD4_590013 [Sinorhizobium medicae]
MLRPARRGGAAPWDFPQDDRPQLGELVCLNLTIAVLVPLPVPCDTGCSPLPFCQC